MRSHGAVASYALGEEVWQAVEDDWRTAPLRPELKATLVFLEKLTLRPDELTAADADVVRAAGVSDAGAPRRRDRLRALQHDRPPRRLVRLGRPELGRVAPAGPEMLEGGYELEAIFQRM